MALDLKMTRVAKASPQAIAAAAARLRSGGLVAMPTETVYGLAADATSDKAVAAIYAAKERPAINPLIVHVLEHRGGARAWPVRPGGREARPRVLAWPPHPGPARRVDLEDQPARARRP